MKSWYVALSVPAIVTNAYGAQFLTVEQAHRALFPAATGFVEVLLELSESQIREVEKRSHTRWHLRRHRVWQAKALDRSLGHVIVDEVYGKHEFITYAIAINNRGKVAGVEILDYRESYGGEVRNPSWRAQFLDKTAGDTLDLDKDIRNISGATLSCQHVTEGIRRLLALYHVVLAGK